MGSNKHGGSRPGAGRSYKYGEPLVTKRVPLSSEGELESALERLLRISKQSINNEDSVRPNIRHSVELPLLADSVEAGDPSQNSGAIESYMDLNDFLGANTSTDFLLRVSGNSMIDAGILPDDVLTVERTKRAKNGNIVIAEVDGGLTVKRFIVEGDKKFLMSENASLPNFSERTFAELGVIGIVRGVARKV